MLPSNHNDQVPIRRLGCQHCGSTIWATRWGMSVCADCGKPLLHVGVYLTPEQIIAAREAYSARNTAPATVLCCTECGEPVTPLAVSLRRCQLCHEDAAAFGPLSPAVAAALRAYYADHPAPPFDDDAVRGWLTEVCHYA